MGVPVTGGTDTGVATSAAETLDDGTPMASTRQWLSKRQSSTVQRLLDAGVQCVRDEGYDQLTVRSVAGRAGVTHTTAYAYFSSKGHLVAEMFWRRLLAVPTPAPDHLASLTERVTAALRGPGLVLADEPELAQAALAAMLTNDPEVCRVRDAVGADLARRIETALGAHAEPELTEAILLAFSGAMLHAGMGYFDFSGVIGRMASVARQLDRT